MPVMQKRVLIDYFKYDLNKDLGIVYRYGITAESEVVLYELPILRRTKKGVYVLSSDKLFAIWCSNTNKKNLYAHATPEGARLDFINKQEARIARMLVSIEQAKAIISKINIDYENYSTI